MSVSLARRLEAIEISGTSRVLSRTKDLQNQGRDIVDLAVGELPFSPPAPVKEAVRQALENQWLGYTDGLGRLSVRQKLAHILSLRHGVAFSDRHIQLTVGGKHAIFNVMMSLLSEGDEVVLAAPFWTSYPQMARLCGAVPVVVPTTLQTGFKMTALQLRASLGPRTKILLLNSPSNPTGAVYTPSEWHEIAAVLKDYPDVAILSDDIYEQILYEEQSGESLLKIAPSLAPRYLIVSGFSKSHALTGWRAGYLAADPSFILAAHKVQSQTVTHTSVLAQIAMEAALDTEDGRFPSDWLAQLKANRRLCCDILAAIQKEAFVEPAGAFYVFFSMKAFIGAGKKWPTDVAFCEDLLEHAGVALVPGAVFGAEGHVRFSFATGSDRLREGMRRFKAFIA